MSYRKTDSTGDYIQTKAGTKLYLKDSAPAFKAIDYSRPKAERPGIASADPAPQKATMLRVPKSSLT